MFETLVLKNPSLEKLNEELSILPKPQKKPQTVKVVFEAPNSTS